jgi:hypothetical protein
VATEERRASETNPIPAPDGANPSVSPAAGLSAKGAARRRFARAGAGTTGVLLTLYSQPGMACTYCGIAPSAAMSAIGQHRTVGTLSHKGPAAVCAGLPPSAWAAASHWPGGCAPGDGFHQHFSCSRFSQYHNETCKTILAGANCDVSKVAQYLMAAYLNVVSGRVNFLSVEALQSCWTEWSTKGYYEPMAGQRWYANDIVSYLYGTMD